MGEPLWNTVRLAGDGAVLLEFGTTVDPAVNRRVHQVAQAVQRAAIEGVWGVVPAYATLLVEFDAHQTAAEKVVEQILDLSIADSEDSGRCFEIPVCYGGPHGPDLEQVANTLQMSCDAVIAQHTATPYLIYCLGFSPGFPLCGVLPENLRIPRHSSPRTAVPAGSVAIAGSQTGIYPIQSPGGWNLIGRTPVRLFRLHDDPLVPYRPGDFLQFQAVDQKQFDELSKAVAAGQEILREVSCDAG